jgi:hypothetical protein
MTEIISISDRSTSTVVDNQTPAKPKPPGRKTLPARGDAQYGRSSVTNGAHMCLTPDAGNAAWGRRYRDIFDLLVGAADNEGQRQQARRCTALAIECEKFEAQIVAGQSIDRALYGILVDRFGRAIECLHDLKGATNK